MSRTEFCLAVIAACAIGVTCFVAGRECERHKTGYFVPVKHRDYDYIAVYDTRTGRRLVNPPAEEQAER